MSRMRASNILFDLLKEVEVSQGPSAPPSWKGISGIKIHSMSPLRFSITVNGKDYELADAGKPTDLYTRNSVPINEALAAFFKASGKKQAEDLTVLNGDTEPWSRSLEDGETAFVLDIVLGSSFSEALWNAYEESLPDRQVVALTDGSWTAVLNDNVEMTGNAVK